MTADKKRKRDSAPGSVEQIRIINAEANDFPPVIATTVGVALPQQVPFKPYTRAAPIDTSKKKRSRPEYLLHGTTPRLDYEGREVDGDSQYHRYYVGIYDPTTDAVELHAAPKVHVTSSIKAHRQRDLEVLEKGTEFTNEERRVALGKAFGTRKAQSALTSREINKVDVTDMDKTVTSAIVSQVEANTKDMPTTEELGRSMQDERPIPKYNADATKPEEAYKREDIISEEEWESIWVSDWIKNNAVNTKSTHVNKRTVALLQDSSKKHTRDLKILKYIAALIDFYLLQQKLRGSLGSLSRNRNMFGNPVLVEAFYQKFTETTAGQAKKDRDGKSKDSGERSRVSPRLEQKILYHLAVLCLMVDKFDVDIYDLKHDLNILPRELAQAFKEVGCSIRELGTNQHIAAKMTKAEALQHKRAVLKIPLEFPAPPKKRAAAAGRR